MRALQVLLELQAPSVSPKRLKLLSQLGSIWACRGVLLVLHGCGCVVAEQLILPLA